LENSFARAPATAEDCSDARREFGKSKWFGKTIVCTCIKAVNSFLQHSGSRKEHYGQIRLSGANPAQSFQPRRALQIQIEQNQIEGLVHRELPSLCTPRCDLNRELLLVQSLLKIPGQRQVIFRHKNSQVRTRG